MYSGSECSLHGSTHSQLGKAKSEEELLHSVEAQALRNSPVFRTLLGASVPLIIQIGRWERNLCVCVCVCVLWCVVCVCVCLGFELRALHLQSRHSTT
jgi:hypothetical protein